MACIIMVRVYTHHILLLGIPPEKCKNPPEKCTKDSPEKMACIIMVRGKHAPHPLTRNPPEKCKNPPKNVLKILRKKWHV